MSASGFTVAEMDHGHRCITCRWYVIWIRRAEAAVARAKAFAHAHHHITRRADESLAHRDRLRADYRAHRNSHTSERGDSP